MNDRLTAERRKMGITGPGSYDNSKVQYDFTKGRKNSNGASDKGFDFSEAVKKYEEAHKISAQDLKKDKDWRDMSDDEWDKVLEGIDKYTEEFKERLKETKELQEKAAQKAAAEAPSYLKTSAAAAAALHAAAGGYSGAVTSDEAEDSDTPDGEGYEKNWTKNLKTDDQIVLRRAKAAQKMEAAAKARYQEAAVTGDPALDVKGSSYYINQYNKNRILEEKQ